MVCSLCKRQVGLASGRDRGLLVLAAFVAACSLRSHWGHPGFAKPHDGPGRQPPTAAFATVKGGPLSASLSVPQRARSKSCRNLAGTPTIRRAAVQWGPLGPAEAAQAFRIYYLPFVDPVDLDIAFGTQFLQLFGPIAPMFVLAVGFWIQSNINSVRREQEGKVVGAAAAAAGNAISERLAEVPTEQWLKLVLCLAIDLAGDATYLFLGLGEAGDLAYAPLEAFALKTLFGGNLIALLGFVEEALPFSDALPTATVGWVLQTLFPANPFTTFLGIRPLDPPRGVAGQVPTLEATKEVPKEPRPKR